MQSLQGLSCASGVRTSALDEADKMGHTVDTGVMR